MACQKCGGENKWLGVYSQKAKPDFYNGTKGLDKGVDGYQYEKWKCKKCGKVEKYFLYKVNDVENL